MHIFEYFDNESVIFNHVEMWSVRTLSKEKLTIKINVKQGCLLMTLC